MATTNINPAAAPTDAPSYSIATLLGARHAPLPQLLARRLIEGLSTSKQEHMAKKSLLLSLGIKKTKNAPGAASSNDPTMQTITDEEMQMIREIMAEIEKIKQW